MGIKYLNKYLTNHCSANSISKKPLSEFRYRTFVIDTSIYLYRFAENNMLIEGFYNMVSIFKKYHITPIFVFDGKPPVEKKELLEKRRAEKNTAEKIYNELKSQLAVESTDKKTELLHDMEALKKKFVRIKPSDIQTVKRLLTAYGTQWIDSIGEADQLCAYMVRQNYAWACVSDDMDMFLYGCTRVIRHISLMNQTGILYNTPEILSELNMSLEMFTDIAILSGTDYNIHQKVNLYETMRLYRTYCETFSEDSKPFHEWLSENAHYAKIELDTLVKVRNMFQLGSFSLEYSTQQMAIPPKIDKTALHDILKSDGFIFV